MRVGQLCGHTSTGLWNTVEMFPIIFATSAALGSLPADGAPVDWLPVNTAAKTIAECLLNSPSSSDSRPKQDMFKVHNVVNPRSIPWVELARMLASALPSGTSLSPLPLVPMSEWLLLLHNAASAGATAVDLPGLKLLGFLEAMAAPESTEGATMFETQGTQGVSETLRGIDAVNEEWVIGWVKVWREGGFVR